MVLFVFPHLECSSSLNPLAVSLRVRFFKSSFLSIVNRHAKSLMASMVLGLMFLLKSETVLNFCKSK